MYKMLKRRDTEPPLSVNKDYQFVRAGQQWLKYQTCMNFVLYQDLSTGWSFSRTIIYIFMVSKQRQPKPSIIHNRNEFC